LDFFRRSTPSYFHMPQCRFCWLHPETDSPIRYQFYIEVKLSLWHVVVAFKVFRQRGFNMSHFLRTSGSGKRFTQPREYNWGATWKKT
jgi:hypothetical protein